MGGGGGRRREREERKKSEKEEKKRRRERKKKILTKMNAETRNWSLFCSFWTVWNWSGLFSPLFLISDVDYCDYLLNLFIYLFLSFFFLIFYKCLFFILFKWNKKAVFFNRMVARYKSSQEEPVEGLLSHHTLFFLFLFFLSSIISTG